MKVVVAIGMVVAWVGCSGAVGLPQGDGGETLLAVDSGTRDAGIIPPDGGDAAVWSCASHHYKFCEDFESASPGTLPAGWTVHVGYGDHPVAPTVVGGVTHSGSRALQSVSAETGQSRLEKSLTPLGATAGTHWGRVFYKVGQPVPTAAGYFHSTFVGLLGPPAESRVFDTVRANPSGHVQFLYNLSNDSCCQSSDYDYTFDDAWHCAEWHVDAPNQAFRFFLDGTEVAKLAFTHLATAMESQYTSILIGTLFYQTPDAPFIAWYDDLALDDAQIGCLP